MKGVMKRHWMIITSVVLSLVGWGIYPIQAEGYILGALMIILVSSWILSIVFGIKGLNSIKKNKKLKKREIITMRVLAIIGIIISSSGITIVILINLIEGFLEGLRS